MKNQPSIEACRKVRFRNSPETLRYFYHPDHIGSTSWVTDNAKNGIQYCEYLPFGEPFLDQRSTTWNSRYTFSGKERDNETGYNYFGARYYNSDISIWLSVDPMSDKYPNLSSYAYCANNPLKFIDPDGRIIGEVDEEARIHIDRVIDKNSPDYNRAFARKYNQLKKSNKIYNFKMGTNENLESNAAGKVMPPNTGENSYDIIFTVGKAEREIDPMGGFGDLSVLFEETYHASRLDKGIDIRTCMEEVRAWKFATKAPGTKMTYNASYINPNTGEKTVGMGYTLANTVKTMTKKCLGMMLQKGMQPFLSDGVIPCVTIPTPSYPDLPWK